MSIKLRLALNAIVMIVAVGIIAGMSLQSLSSIKASIQGLLSLRSGETIAASRGKAAGALAGGGR